ncbi:type II toxin-antitoxin system HigB family toxin [Acinetobacter seifertii]|uniref:type II toxin-antitoxin system HigB family toxin n=1 Tax=Acinetobacter seifertii TaxID=1530123 RepID=UPI0019017CA3|nr:type II toxin-antitoxin system HigB family toxin [Acinetobacter seifertii]MBJ8504111.1 type II toxin-antitoxin system HigB family toxin [Acinetobacter seifertii]
MKLLGLDKITVIEGEFAKKWLMSWISEIRDAHWRHAEDIVKQFPRVSILENHCFEFSIHNSNWVICLQIAFAQRVAIIKDVTAKDAINGI